MSRTIDLDRLLAGRPPNADAKLLAAIRRFEKARRAFEDAFDIWCIHSRKYGQSRNPVSDVIDAAADEAERVLQDVLAIPARTVRGVLARALVAEWKPYALWNENARSPR